MNYRCRKKIPNTKLKHSIAGISRSIAWICSFTHVVDPAAVGADPGEDGGLLGVVAAGAGAEADNTVDGPGAIRVLAVQGTTRVSLQEKC